MNKYARIYIGIILSIIATVVIVGVVLPALVSAQNDYAFLSAIVIGCAYLPMIAILLKWTFTNPKPQLKKETQENV
jgi:heme/copper-type cytochrome/quinol oxidase subunit 4